MTVVSITLPEELLSQFEKFMESRGYYSRSEAFRDAIRNLIAESEINKLGEEKSAATIMITSEYKRKDVENRISEIRHEFDDIIIENIHRHIKDQYCLEILIAEGDSKRLLDLMGRVRGIRGIQQVKAVFMPILES
ncbi:MAG: nickel-responsive transcriptional regulator NikR [Candidatus Jordarchaeaceae archaeon]|nr:nickel-responsive transcriptional regulator NikR [Candidatus Jordarchaeia archaeon]MBS7268347.1 nickel-responsive transcriptional regulator NikR [Candidatus Jordarchaeia archaeon]MBS7278478.1 nickel-responsive transcriptional regulator NikR [Candidatus Jordarchaeia archaeon]